MRLSLTPVQVAVDGVDEGFLVFLDERLVAVLTKLDESYGAEAGRWFLEAGFGRLDGKLDPFSRAARSSSRQSVGCQDRTAIR